MNSTASNVRNLRAVEAPPGKVLRIVAGLHAGATRPLAEQEMLVVGSGDDCDIVLADTGVAAHHALITLVGGTFTLRALDAPIRVEGKPLHPGDPVEIRALQRIDLGEAAIAFGDNDGAAWDALFPSISDPARRQRARPWLRRLPLIAAAAVLALATVAVIAAFLPGRDTKVNAQAYLQALVPQFGVSQHQISTDVNGIPSLAGTVESEAVRARAEQQLRESGVEASLALRVGDDLARDVQEVFRMAGASAKARYTGNGTVTVDDIDREVFDRVLSSRALADVGAKVIPGESIAPASATANEKDPIKRVAMQPPVDIVSIVKGRTPYAVDLDGNQYPMGDMIPGHGEFIGVGTRNNIYVKGPDGAINSISTITAAELAARTAPTNFGNVTGGETGTPAKLNGARARQAVNVPSAKIPHVPERK